jgi:ribosomal protein S18 acetylase RimI-like enzyme
VTDFQAATGRVAVRWRPRVMALLEDAKERGWRSVRLETTADWEDAVQFYRAFGFELTRYEDGTFGRDASFRMVL